MSEDKKKSIDLKQRLGKKTVTTQGGPSIPPPVGLPKPPGMPNIGSSPAAAAPPPPPPKPQEIIVDSKDVQEAAGRNRIVTAIVGGAAALVGIGLGFVIGQSVQKNVPIAKARQDAAALTTDIKAANEVIDRLAIALKNARQKLTDGAYPEAEVKELSNLKIPFDGSKIVGKEVTKFQQDTVAKLMTYVGKVAEADDERETVQLLLEGRKAKLQEEIDARNQPKVTFGILFSQQAGAPVGQLTLLTTPFDLNQPPGWQPRAPKDDKEKAEWEKDPTKKPKFEWPKDIKLKQGEAEKDFVRYETPKSFENKDKKDVILPLNPASFSQACPTGNFFSQALRAVIKVQEIIDPAEAPGQDAVGLRVLGKELQTKLGEIGG